MELQVAVAGSAGCSLVHTGEYSRRFRRRRERRRQCGRGLRKRLPVRRSTSTIRYMHEKRLNSSSVLDCRSLLQMTGATV